LKPLASEKGQEIMAKKSAVEKNNRRKRIVAAKGARRAALRAIIRNRELPLEERFNASLKLAREPRDSAQIRIRNRCEVSGRPRGYYRKLKMSRIALRELAAFGQVPGVVKSSW
jgi:small subunit ribosomal protein S14